MKRCFKCGQDKDISEFYPHPKMADGHLNKCKECAKQDVRKNYRADPEKRRAYEAARSKRPERRAKNLVYQKRRRTESPEKYEARTAAGNAIRDGRLTRQPCEKCGSPDVEAHHEDYSRPLDVNWLCLRHHRQRHGRLVS